MPFGGNDWLALTQETASVPEKLKGAEMCQRLIRDV